MLCVEWENQNLHKTILYIISSSGKNLGQSFYHKMETDNGLSLHIV